MLDDYSRAVAGYTLFLSDPTTEQIALALHQAAGRKSNPAWPVTGLPGVLCSDHGSDFTSARLERSAWTPTSAWSTPGSAFRRAAARSSGSSAPSPASWCRTCPGTSRTAPADSP